MNVNLLGTCTHLIRSQVEFSESTQTMILRCILEVPATGERRGFVSMDALMETLRDELTDMQNQIVTRSIPNNKET